MESKELARLLGISHQMVNRLKKRGMPTDSLTSAIDWRKRNLDLTQTKSWRIDGNKGVKLGFNSAQNETAKTLTKVMPELWFDQAGYLATALRESGVQITAEQVMEAQHYLFLMYMSLVDEYLKCENHYQSTPILVANPESEIWPSLMARLNQILSEELTPREFSDCEASSHH
ncbi:MAG: hypothetical protein H0W85_09640 [Methylotenera sp.]|nr:hypothetical protein [Methylotenera sp.]